MFTTYKKLFFVLLTSMSSIMFSMQKNEESVYEECKSELARTEKAYSTAPRGECIDFKCLCFYSLFEQKIDGGENSLIATITAIHRAYLEDTDLSQYYNVNFYLALVKNLKETYLNKKYPIQFALVPYKINEWDWRKIDPNDAVLKVFSAIVNTLEPFKLITPTTLPKHLLQFPFDENNHD